MSILHSRIIAQAGTGQQVAHPAVTPATPQVMPMARVTYQGTTGFYEDLFPGNAASADPNHVPLASAPQGTWARVVPAGVI